MRIRKYQAWGLTLFAIAPERPAIVLLSRGYGLWLRMRPVRGIGRAVAFVRRSEWARQMHDACD